MLPSNSVCHAICSQTLPSPPEALEAEGDLVSAGGAWGQADGSRLPRVRWLHPTWGDGGPRDQAWLGQHCTED